MSNADEPLEPPVAEASVNPAVPVQHPFVRYTLARLSLFFVALVLGYVVGLRSFLLLLVALLVSGVASYFLLNRHRDAASTVVYPKVSKVKSKLEQRRADEDAAADALRAEQDARRASGGALLDENGQVDGRGHDSDAEQNGENQL